MLGKTIEIWLPNTRNMHQISKRTMTLQTTTASGNCIAIPTTATTTASGNCTATDNFTFPTATSCICACLCENCVAILLLILSTQMICPYIVSIVSCTVCTQVCMWTGVWHYAFCVSTCSEKYTCTIAHGLLFNPMIGSLVPFGAPLFHMNGPKALLPCGVVLDSSEISPS